MSSMRESRRSEPAKWRKAPAARNGEFDTARRVLPTARERQCRERRGGGFLLCAAVGGAWGARKNRLHSPSGGGGARICSPSGGVIWGGGMRMQPAPHPKCFAAEAA